MDIESHKPLLQAAYDELRESSIAHNAALDAHPFNPVHPERWRAFGGNAKALGKCAVELIRLAPHLAEIRTLHKEKDN